MFRNFIVSRCKNEQIFENLDDRCHRMMEDLYLVPEELRKAIYKFKEEYSSVQVVLDKSGL